MVASIQAGDLELDNVRHLILDEADRLLDKEFLDQTQEIVALCTHPQCQKMVFSATLPANAETIALGMLNDPIRVVVGLKRATFFFIFAGELTTSQRHSPPEYQTNSYIRRSTRSQTSNAPPVPDFTSRVYTAYHCLHLDSSSCDLVAFRAVACGSEERRSTTRGYDTCRTRRSSETHAEGGGLGIGLYGSHGPWHGLWRGEGCDQL